MARPLFFAAIVSVWFACAAPAAAGEVVLKASIGGQTLSCTDFRGVPVRMIEMDDLGDVGRALLITRMPVIALDPARLAQLPPALQIFFYQHECAHHVLGHIYAQTIDSEMEADCWSINFGRDNNLFTRADVEGFAPYLARSRGSPFGHLPGPKRAAFLLSCFDNVQPSSQAALDQR